KKSHTAVIIDGSGRQVGESLTVGDGPDSAVELITWVSCLGNGAARFAIEDGRGLARQLADALVAAGFPVAWVPVRLMVAARRLLPARGKSDPIDALASLSSFLCK